jgi:hypothetical protein
MKRDALIIIGLACAATLAANLCLAQTRGTKLRLPCEYKSISVPTDNAANQKLIYSYDLKQIASTMRQEFAYEVSDHYNGDGIVVSRTFGGVKYNIVFENRGGASSFNLNTYNFKGYPGRGTVAWGEKCTKPNYLIKRNVYRMIDDLPLDAQQKAELKKYVVVAKMINGRIF